MLFTLRPYSCSTQEPNCNPPYWVPYKSMERGTSCPQRFPARADCDGRCWGSEGPWQTGTIWQTGTHLMGHQLWFCEGLRLLVHCVLLVPQLNDAFEQLLHTLFLHPILKLADSNHCHFWWVLLCCFSLSPFSSQDMWDKPAEPRGYQMELTPGALISYMKQIPLAQSICWLQIPDIQANHFCPSLTIPFHLFC